MSIQSVLTRRGARYPSAAFAVLGCLLCAAAVIHLGLGARAIAPRVVIDALLHYDPHNFDHRIIVSLRLTRLLAALMTGAALGVAGLLLQTVIRNPLGEPHILGLNAGATLAVVACSAAGISFGEWGVSRPLTGAGGAALLFGLVMLLASSGRAGATAMKITLCGVALSAFASAVTASILILDEQTLQAMRTWLAGDLSGVSMHTLRVASLPALLGVLLAAFLAPRLNILALGDRVASSLGVAVTRTRILGVLAIALLCGASVSIAGPIGFIGLVVPHAIRRWAGQDIRIGLLLALPTGALLLLLADILARWLLAPQELATGVMTALVGAPIFIAIAVRFFK
ncbi:FecCD family ABC transporter permease [Kluyvera sp. Awk 3]|uniref:FecCD family ABC transporter permease n=1 Tax=Kluyvera sp. Awk 3 TaxID=2963956 RepID=UPI0023038384|nr:iron ABC transporter permease [Kluyvera sp. Awk 3]MDA8489873.1 iron ABC transporter permease [Kluyvera sp. Awk 3]